MAPWAYEVEKIRCDCTWVNAFPSPPAPAHKPSLKEGSLTQYVKGSARTVGLSSYFRHSHTIGLHRSLHPQLFRAEIFISAASGPKQHPPMQALASTRISTRIYTDFQIKGAAEHVTTKLSHRDS